MTIGTNIAMPMAKRSHWARGARLVVLAVATLLVAACATTPSSPQGASELRAKLGALQSDPNLAQHAPVEIREAEEAVQIAERPLSRSSDPALVAHRMYMADHKVEIARARAMTRHAESQRSLLGEERERARLAARTREADRAHADARIARGATERAQAEAQAARSEADRARMAEAESDAAAARRAAELQRQIEILEAEITSRGLVLTLGDVLFATASAELQGGAHTNLDKLVDFLNQYPERRVHVEGHTDNVGAAEYNRDLSQRRADSVRYFLTQQGVASGRITTAGMGMDRPVASNASASGRQMNRRVEIIIENPQDSQASAGSGQAF